MRDPQPPKKPFSLPNTKLSKEVPSATIEKQQTVANSRDNAMPRMPPPSFARTPAPNLAPPGMSGIKRSAQPTNLPHLIPKETFKAGAGGELTKAFKSIAEPTPNKDHNRDR